VVGKYLGVIIGAIIVLLGLMGVISWRADLLTVLKGSVPVILILGGAIAVVAGLNEIKDESSAKK
jgi:hypothetical protein